LKNKLSIVITGILILISLNQVSAQTRISSPYSRFGVGELFQNTHVNNMAMGGISQGIYNPYFVNAANPASYTAFDTLSFVFDASLHARFTKLSTTTANQTADYASLGNLLFGFPITGWWKASFGLMPYSSTGYNMTDVHTDSIFESYSNVYEGSGGINQFYIGSSFDLNRRLSVGINVSYLFGTINHNTATVFPDSLYRYNVKTINSTRVHDFVPTLGIMYNRALQKGYHYTIGASFFAQSKINVTADKLSYSYTSSATGVESRRDTIQMNTGTKETITLPTGLGVGFSFGRNESWLIGADFTYKQWENFKFAAAQEPLVNNMQFAIGGFINPSSSTVSNYLQRLTYRAGLRYSDGILELRNQRINEFGITFGVGLPLPRTNSTINLGFEVGSRGTEKENLIKENYVKFTLGLSIFERWFVIRKYQ
jgi:hypothetical protein